MLWIFVALAIIAVTTLATTAVAMLFVQWMLGLDGFFVSVQDPADTFQKDEAAAFALSRELVRDHNSLV